MNLNRIEMGRNFVVRINFIVYTRLEFSVPEMMIKRITYQVLNAVDFCHRHNVRKMNFGGKKYVYFFCSVFIVVS
jgi:hypothetical protein